MKHLLWGGLAVLAFAQDSRKAPSEAELNRFVFFAVLEGAYEDGIGPDALDVILKKNEKGEYSNFIYECPICTPSVEAFRAFAQRQSYYYGRKGEAYFGPASEETRKLMKEIVAGGQSDRYNKALDALMKRYISRRLDSLKLSDADRAVWLKALKVGQEKMKNTYDHCPWCAGAADPR